MEEINNKNGYIVMGEEGYYSDREVEPYAYTKTQEEAIIIANEAVRQAKKRKPVSEKSPHYHKKDSGFDRVRVYNLDTMQDVGPLFLKSDAGGIHLVWERNGYYDNDRFCILYPGEKDDDDTYKARARKSRLLKIQENNK